MQLLLNGLSNAFVTVFNMSITASVIIAFVFLARLCLRRVPRGFSYALWAVVLFRLLCPISFALPFAVVGITGALPAEEIQTSTMQYISPELTVQQNKTDVTVNAHSIENGTPMPDDASDRAEVVPNESTTATTQDMTVTTDGAQGISFDVVTVVSAIWLLGAVGLFGANCFSLLRLKKKLRDAAWHSIAAQSGGTTVPYWNKRKGKHVRIYQSDAIPTAFVLGVLRPCIYLPSHLSPKEHAYILQHEQTHIARRDPFWQCLAFCALCLHWFNPLVWLAFKANQKDMELSCDERVLRQMGSDIKKEYAQSLLNLSRGRSAPLHHVLAFGESSAKSRIKNVLSYQNPVFWVRLAASATLLIVGVLLIANPMPSAAIEAQAASSDTTANSDVIQTATAQSTAAIPYGTIDITPTERDALFADVEAIQVSEAQLLLQEAVLVYASADKATVLIPSVNPNEGDTAQTWYEVNLANENGTWLLEGWLGENTGKSYASSIYIHDETDDIILHIWRAMITNEAPQDEIFHHVIDLDGDGVNEIFSLATQQGISTLWCYHDRTYENLGQVTGCDIGTSAQTWIQVGTRTLYTVCITTALSTWVNIYTVHDGEVVVFEGIGQSITQGDESRGESASDFTVMVNAYDSNYMLNANNDGLLYTGRTTKPYDLYWDEENCTLRAYEAVEISIESLSTLGALGDIDAITAQMEATRKKNTGALQIDAVYQFANGKIKINYRFGNEETGSCYYLAYALEDGVLKDETPTDNSGFYLPAAYPEAAVYPAASENDISFPDDFVWSEVVACVQALNECYTQNYDTALRDENTPLRAGFLDEAYHPFYPDILFPAQEIDQYRDTYYFDSALTDYYFIANYQTLAQFNDALRTYLSQDVIDGQNLTSNFIEYEGALYLIRGATGYGAYHIDIESLTFIKHENNQYFFTANAGLFEEITGSVNLTFKYIDGRLILTEDVTG